MRPVRISPVRAGEKSMVPNTYLGIIQAFSDGFGWAFGCQPVSRAIRPAASKSMVVWPECESVRLGEGRADSEIVSMKKSRRSAEGGYVV